MDTYQTCIQALFDAYQIPFLIYIYRERERENTEKDPSKRAPNRGPPTIYRHHEGLRIKKEISKGVVYKLSEPKRTAKCIPPPGLHWRCSSWLLWGWCADCAVRRPNTALRLTHVRERKLAVPPLSIIPILG